MSADRKKRSDEPYFIEVDENGCNKCGHGRTWTVIGPDGSAAGQSWDEEEDAAAFAEALNDAFYMGVASDEVRAVK